jgi:alpha-beta hydrolase superfamily lysophospholipase
MVRRCFRWIGRHRKLAVFIILTFMIVAVNVIAYNHARALTYTSEGDSTPRPETLSAWDKVKIVFSGVNIPRPVNRLAPTSQGLSYETAVIQSTDGVQLELWQIPRARSNGVVLLAHGFASSKASLLREARAFHDLGYTTCLLDFRGSGGSSGSDTSIGVHEADDIACCVAHLRQTYPGEPLALYGQSMGSVAVLRAIAEKGVRPQAVIIESPFDRLLSTVGNRFSAMGLPAFPGAQLLVFWGGVQQGFNGFSHNPVDYARRVNCPVLLMHGARDTRVTQEQVRSVLDCLAGPKQLVEFAAAEHEPCIGSDMALWQRTTAEFLETCIK